MNFYFLNLYKLPLNNLLSKPFIKLPNLIIISETVYYLTLYLNRYIYLYVIKTTLLCQTFKKMILIVNI